MLLIKCCFLTFFVFISFHNNFLKASESIKELNENVQNNPSIWMLKQASRGDQETRHLYDLPDFLLEDIMKNVLENAIENVLESSDGFTPHLISKLFFYNVITRQLLPQPSSETQECTDLQPNPITSKKISYDFSSSSPIAHFPNIARWLWQNFVTSVDNIPFEMFPYLEGTQIQAIYLNLKQFKNYTAFFLNFKKFLEKTKIDTLILAPNSIINTAIKLAKSLRGTKIGTLDLSNNKVNSHFTSFAIVLYNTSIHTLNLSNNGISDLSALELIKVLNRTKICRLDLSHNPISDATRRHIIGFNLPIEIIF